jgi:hypothetical protein
MVAVPEHLASDLAEVEIDSEEEFWALLPELLQELETAGPGVCYRGWRPDPERSGEPEVNGLKLWPFVWASKKLGCEIYMKFCLKERKNGSLFYAHVRIHKNR